MLLRFPTLVTIPLLLFLFASPCTPSPSPLNITFTTRTNFTSSPPLSPICFPPLNHSTTATTQTCTPILLDLSTTSTSSIPRNFSSDQVPYVYGNTYSACTITLLAIPPSPGRVSAVQLTTKQIASSAQKILNRCAPSNRGGNVTIGDIEGGGSWVLEVSARDGWQVENIPKNVSMHLG